MSNISITVKTFPELTNEDIYEILKARFAVFVIEQRCFYLDMDDIDYTSTHVFMQKGREVVAYARMFPESDTNIWHIGRVLTTIRGKGLGIQLMGQAIKVCESKGANAIKIEAQTHAIEFYRRLGFVVTSGEFMDAGIPHVNMHLDINRH